MQLQVSSPMNLISNLKRLLTENENNLPGNWSYSVKDIETKRKELSIIAELEKYHRVKERKVRNIDRKYNIWRNQSRTEVKEILKK